MRSQAGLQGKDDGIARRPAADVAEAVALGHAHVQAVAGAEVAFARHSDRVSEQHVWVLEGEIEIATGGAVYSLAAGDCLHMRVAEGNRFRNVSGRPARYAVILALEPSL